MDSAVRKALKAAAGVRKFRKKDMQLKAREAKKVEIVGKELSTKLHLISVSFPSIEQMHPFHVELISLSVEIASIKKSLAHLEKSSKLLKKLRFEAIKGVYSAKIKEEIIRERKRFFARADSILSKAEGSLKTVSKAEMLLKGIPKLRLDCLTVILAGFPNTGKTTILSRLTKSKPKIATYPFTTKGLNFGYMPVGYRDIQVIDSPGLLDREMEERNVIERKAIAALKHLAEIVVFVVDPTENCGYALEKQLNLLEEIRKFFKNKIIVVVNKADIATKEELERTDNISGRIICGEGIKCRLRELLESEAVKAAK